eukprot:CAMPEP_0181523916 /NCGR_PEP_ID=MMETSP1110-20121109/68151_1 /TAXON_ID=174948 /ORGANISM="Symbiodinium sp., Strain CCMP421" /LENGTH=39 /DNA_ID= /DNA_START= /DNA_END= /DNA_ORIENTATION=
MTGGDPSTARAALRKAAEGLGSGATVGMGAAGGSSQSSW